MTVENLARSLLQSSQALPEGVVLPEGRLPPDPARNIDAALRGAPTLVILSFPTNDAVANVPAEQTVAAWRSIRDHAAASGAATLVLGTQPRAGLSAAQQSTLVVTDELAGKAFGPCFVPLRERLAGADGAPAAPYSAGDGIHLNAQGHALIFERVTAQLTDGRCVRPPVRPE